MLSKNAPFTMLALAAIALYCGCGDEAVKTEEQEDMSPDLGSLDDMQQPSEFVCRGANIDRATVYQGSKKKPSSKPQSQKIRRQSVRQVS